MKYLAIAATAASLLAIAPAKAAVPAPILALLGPGIGYMLGQSDLCSWNLNTQIKTTYQTAFTQMGMTATEQAAAWQAAAAREAKLNNMPTRGKEGMKKGICTEAAHTQLLADIGAQ